MTFTRRQTLIGLLVAVVGVALAYWIQTNPFADRTNEKKDRLESAIRTELPAQLRERLDLKVDGAPRVTCVARTDTEFDCQARAQIGAPIPGAPSVPETFAITASCDDENCQWRTES